MLSFEETELVSARDLKIYGFCGFNIWILDWTRSRITIFLALLVVFPEANVLACGSCLYNMVGERAD